MNSEKIAVLLSSYNGEKYILQQVNSILHQKIDCDLRLLVRDDGSTDSTLNILNSVKDERLLVFPESNCGCNASFFRIIQKAYNLLPDFDYFALSDQDDVWDEDKLQIGVNAIRKSGGNESVLYGSASRAVTVDLKPIQRRRQVRRPVTFYNSIIQNFIAGHTQIMNRRLLEKISSVDPTDIYCYDSFIINVAILTGKVLYDEVPHVSYRQHGDNLLGTSNKSFFSWIKCRLERLRNDEVRKFAKQIEYINSFCEKFMTVDQKKEINLFLTSRNNLLERFRYLISKKVYRQERFDDLAFCLLYLCGAYNT